METQKSQFSDDISKNSNLSKNEPQCMKDISLSQPLDRASHQLTKEEFENAKTVLVNRKYLDLKFPKIKRQRDDDPLPGQSYCMFVFLPSKEAKPDSDGCYGTIKFRGTFHDDQAAAEYGEKIIYEKDTYNENMITYTGRDFPLTDNFDQYCETTQEVDMRAKLDEPAKEKISKARAKEKGEQKEVMERQQQLLTDVKKDEKERYDDLEYYTTLRQKRANIRIMQEDCEKKIKESAKLLKKTNEEIFSLDEKYPAYQKEYMEKYKAALESIGGDTRGNKMIEYMK